MGRVILDRGERFRLARGAMIGMDGGAEVSTGLWGSAFRGLQRRLTGVGGFLMNTYRGRENRAEVLFAAVAPGDIEPLELGRSGMIVRKGCFLGSGIGVKTRGAWAGLASLLVGQGGFALKCKGEGVVFVSGYGAIRVVELGDGEACLVERGCVVAYDGTVRMAVSRLGTLFNALVLRRLMIGKYRGPGRLVVQNRQEVYLEEWLRRELPKRAKFFGELERAGERRDRHAPRGGDGG